MCPYALWSFLQGSPNVHPTHPTYLPHPVRRCVQDAAILYLACGYGQPSPCDIHPHTWAHTWTYTPTHKAAISYTYLSPPHFICLPVCMSPMCISCVPLCLDLVCALGSDIHGCGQQPPYRGLPAELLGASKHGVLVCTQQQANRHSPDHAGRSLTVSPSSQSQPVSLGHMFHQVPTYMI